ncbi:hypothetical protein CEB41_16300 (plasmid) [Lactiplantibacillus plantarum]|uniref:restriction endonuclease subunit S n=1 Tax=Lactiplantibacillus plantarum TaxID=1590 RepID=UPI000E0951A0|nr:restriction endonuclease subunit S [Lactiplantibacillus plantarum]AXH06031.1 hypothetical protein CEB41_16300 [Lactiplantibacillus plantarum]
METRTVRLGDFATFVNEKCYLNEASRNTYVSTENLKPNRLGVFFPITKLPQTNKVNTFAKGDILIANIRPYFKKIWHANIAGTHSTDVLNIRSNSKQLLQSYLAVVLSNDRFFDYMMATSKGTKMPRGDKKAIMDFKFELPSFKDQIIISDSISVINQKIELNRQINKNLLRLAKQQFNLTFPNVHEGNSRLSNVMENFDRKRIPLARREREKRQSVYRYVGATSVLDYVDDYLFDGTYLLMGEDGTVQDEKGFPILQYIWGKFWPNNHTHVLRGTFVSTEWLYLFLMNTNVRSRITGAVQQKISQANMNSIPLTIPSKDELFRFQKQIEPVFSQIQLLDEQNLKLTAIHKLLLPKLLAGQIDLSNLEGAIQNA